MDVVCVGVMVADVLASGVNRTVFDNDITRVPIKFSTGGDAFNQAVNLSLCDYKVALCGKVGNDNIGTFLMTEAQSKGIDTANVKRDDDHQTSVTIVLINENGDRNFIGTQNGTNSYLVASDVNTSVFEHSKIVSIGSIYGSVSFSGIEAAKVLKKAKEFNCITVADMMHADRGTIDEISDAVKNVDYFIPNFKEAQLLTGKEDVNEIADILLNLGVKCVVVKLGEKGCFVKSKSDEICQFVDSFKTEKVVDTTGAGDAFVSGFISGLIDGCNTIECAKRGCAAGCIAIQSIGATGGITSKQQILDIVHGI